MPFWHILPAAPPNAFAPAKAWLRVAAFSFFGSFCKRVLCPVSHPPLGLVRGFWLFCPTPFPPCFFPPRSAGYLVLTRRPPAGFLFVRTQHTLSGYFFCYRYSARPLLLSWGHFSAHLHPFSMERLDPNPPASLGVHPLPSMCPCCSLPHFSLKYAGRDDLPLPGSCSPCLFRQPSRLTPLLSCVFLTCRRYWRSEHGAS